MTFIQPNKQHDILNIILGVLIVALLGTTFSLIVLYNHIVDLNHNITALKAETNTVGAENTSSQNQIIGTLNDSQLQSLAAADGLVLDNHPQYVQAPASLTTVAVNE